MSAFKDLKKNRGSYADRLKKELDKHSTTFQEDERLWWVKAEKKETVKAKVKILPSQHNENPVAMVFYHAFKNPVTNRWYIENSRTTIDEKDPVSESNNYFWERGEKQIARDRARKKRYFANVLIIDDPKDPDNNGQVRVMRFGKQIFDKIKDEADGDNNPFDLWNNIYLVVESRIGANGFRSYEGSHFIDAPSKAKYTDAQLETWYNETHNLDDFMKFKEYDELKKRFLSVWPSELSQGPFAGESFASGEAVPAGSSEATAPQSSPKHLTQNEEKDDDDVPAWEDNTEDEEKEEEKVAVPAGSEDAEVDEFFNQF